MTTLGALRCPPWRRMAGVMENWRKTSDFFAYESYQTYPDCQDSNLIYEVRGLVGMSEDVGRDFQFIFLFFLKQSYHRVRVASTLVYEC